MPFAYKLYNFTEPSYECMGSSYYHSLDRPFLNLPSQTIARFISQHTSCATSCAISRKTWKTPSCAAIWFNGSQGKISYKV